MNLAFSRMLGRRSQCGRLRIQLCLGMLLAVLVVPPLLGARLLGGVAWADAAEIHYKRGVLAYEAKDYARAIREFQSAYKVRQLPRILLNIGQVYRKLGMASTALKFYEHYLRVDPKAKPEVKAEVDRYIAQTRAMLDPPDIVPLPSKSAAAAAAEAVASAPSDITPVPEMSESLDGTPGKGRGKGPKGRPGIDPGPVVAVPSTGWSLRPTPVVPPPIVLVVPPPEKPFYKKGWFWGVIGGVAAGAIITGVAISATRSNGAPPTVLYPTK